MHNNHDNHDLKLEFTPYAWAKLNYLCHKGDTEVGFFGLSSKDDPLLVHDVKMIKQQCSAVTVEFDDDALADYYMDMHEEGYEPCEFSRIWIHTHPGKSATPSQVDEETFQRVFSRNDWAVMCILSRTQEVYTRIKFTVPFPMEVEIPYYIAYDVYEDEEWDKEYNATVTKRPDLSVTRFSQGKINIQGPINVNPHYAETWEPYDPYRLDDWWSDFPHLAPEGVEVDYGTAPAKKPIPYSGRSNVISNNDANGVPKVKAKAKAKAKNKNRDSSAPKIMGSVPSGDTSSQLDMEENVPPHILELINSLEAADALDLEYRDSLLSALSKDPSDITSTEHEALEELYYSKAYYEGNWNPGVFDPEKFIEELHQLEQAA